MAELSCTPLCCMPHRGTCWWARLGATYLHPGWVMPSQPNKHPQHMETELVALAMTHTHIPILAARGHEAPVWAEPDVGDSFSVALVGVDAGATPDVPHLHCARGESGQPLQALPLGRWCLWHDVLRLRGVSQVCKLFWSAMEWERIHASPAPGSHGDAALPQVHAGASIKGGGRFMEVVLHQKQETCRQSKACGCATGKACRCFQIREASCTLRLVSRDPLAKKSPKG